jgi:hypothetical protein
MKRFRTLLLPLAFMTALLFNLAILPGCATTSTGTQVSATHAASTSLIAAGDLIKQTPAVADALFAAGTIDKAQYNQIADAYTKAQAAYIVAVDAAEAAVQAGNDPDIAAAAQVTLTQLATSAGDLQTLLAAFRTAPPQGGK